ncbi:MAG: Crp/Fnr family transcriptional regulator [Oscillatoriales cyanobacterium]|nr:MAG: Crp/Fnr family transcriptional regulator [Oscillatoriales cyanobacterium]
MRSPLLDPVTFDLRFLLEAQYRSQGLLSFRAGQAVPLLSDRLWVVYRGLVTLETSFVDGSEAILGFVGPGMMFGSGLSAIEPYRSVAITATDLLPLSWVQVSQSPLLARSLLAHGLRRFSQACELKALLTLKRAEDRLWELLQLLDREFGQTYSQGRRLSLRLTHRQLANATQTTRVTVTRILQTFQTQGWLWIDDDRHFWFPTTARKRSARD